MDLDRNTIDGLLQAVDKTIIHYDESVELIEREFHALNNPGGTILDNYSARKKHNEEMYVQKIGTLRDQINQLCERLKHVQPVLKSLQEENINSKFGFPRSLVFGRYRVKFDRPGKEMDFHVPRMLPFPLHKPVRIDQGSEIPFIHQLLLRLLFALPVDKQEYYFFDPRGLGSSVSSFNRLFTSEKLVPQQKVMMSTQELKDALKHIELYIRDLYTHTFNAGFGKNWEEYNRYWYERNERRKMLPYRVFLFMDVPLEMDQDCFRMFRNLLEHNGECGILVLFSCNEAILTNSKNRIRSNMEQELLQIVAEKSIHPTECFLPVQCQRLMLSSADEAMPSVDKLREMTAMVCEAAKVDLGSMFSFAEMLSEDHLFSGASDCGLELPIGYDITGGSAALLRINDRTPHYLIGGTTGSGKSNLLHNLIVSACWNYAPDELNVYLLDFKDGVEFNQYAMKAPFSLPHAVLVATEANTEYGVTVLRYLDEELTRRARLFKGQGCKDIRSYRKKNTGPKLPRILVIIDEFQVLFDSAQKANTMERMTRIAKQGRSAGVHLILATQSIKGMPEFPSIATQFSGRIALKCAAEDSKAILGGTSSNNEAATELEIPYAIMNTSQGSIAGNVKFAVPEAKSEEITHKLNRIFYQTNQQSIRYCPTKVFSGQFFPDFPDRVTFETTGFALTLGKTLSYEEDILRCRLLSKLEHNVLICGHNPVIKAGLLQAILLSADSSHGCDEIAYVGEDEDFIVQSYSAKKPLRIFADAYVFAQAYEDSWQEKKVLTIFDNRNLAKEVGFSSGGFSSFGAQRETDTAKISIKNYWDIGNTKGSHFIAFFDSGTRIKSSGMPLADFMYRIAYDVNDEEMNILLGTTHAKTGMNRKERAFLIENQEILSVFRPFLRPEWRQ